MRRGRVVAVGCALVAVVGGLAAWLLRPARAPEWGREYDLSAAPPEVIAPGTVVGTSAPAGWSHLVIKSLPRVRESERERVPAAPVVGRDLTVRMASWMFTAFAADVVRDGPTGRYRFRAVGLGLGARAADGRDVVVTSSTAKAHGVEMNWIKEQVLDTGYRVQGRAVLPVRGPTFALLDTPVIARCTDRNRYVRYRYALLIDPATGGLDVLLWVLGGEGGECADLTRAVLLPPNCLDEAELVPDPREFDGPKPTDLSFAVDRLPPYRVEMVLPAALRAQAAQTKFAPAEARALEDGLRTQLAEHRP